MAAELGVGERFGSVACATEVIILTLPGAPIELACGGSAMVPAGEAMESGEPLDPAFAAGTQVGKRYWHADSGLEVLCTKSGEGSLSVAGVPLEQKTAAFLPASD